MKTLYWIGLMTYKGKTPKNQIESMKKASHDTDIRAIHPDKLEEFAAHLVNELKNERKNQQH